MEVGEAKGFHGVGEVSFEYEGQDSIQLGSTALEDEKTGIYLSFHLQRA